MALFQKKTYDYLIVGLGNPGEKYSGSRHNAGYAALDVLAEMQDVPVTKIKFHALCGSCIIGKSRCLLLKPITYMNLSGQAVQAAAAYYKIPVENILVLFDDIDLDPGRIRIRKQGSAGGHNGLKSIISCLGSQDFPRIKIGVGSKPHPDYDLADWVLSRFPSDLKDTMQDAFRRAAEAAVLTVREGADAAANKYNSKS